MSDFSSRRTRFFNALNERLNDGGSPVSAGTVGGLNWRRHSLGVSSGFCLVSAVQRGEMKAELLIQRPDARSFFDQLISEMSIVEHEFGASLNWFPPTGDVQRARIAVLNPDFDIELRHHWDAQIAWLVENLEKLQTVFVPRIERLL